MQKGKATGPQKEPKAVEQQGSDPVDRVDDRSRKLKAYEAVRIRMQEEAERLNEAAANLPTADGVLDPFELPLEALRSFEAKMSELRVDMDQMLDVIG